MLIREIQGRVKELSHSDIPNLIEEIAKELTPFVNSLSTNPVTRGVVWNITKEKIGGCLAIFITDPSRVVNLEGYLRKSIRLRCHEVLKERNSIHANICPYCHFLGDISILEGSGQEGSRREYKCARCFLSDDPKRKIFATQSYRGGVCQCGHWIPFSAFNNDLFFPCPYCGVDNSLLDLFQVSKHPSVSLPSESGFASSEFSSGNVHHKLSENQSSEVELLEAIDETMYHLEEIIPKLIMQIPRQFRTCTQEQRRCMYLAIHQMVTSHPQEMYAFLTKQNRASYENIKAQLFRVYVELLTNELPFKLERNNVEYYITDLEDPLLSLFSGQYQFWSEVDAQGVILNQTPEHYIGKAKDYGPYYLGKLLEIKSSEGEDLMNEVRDYSFTQIWINPEWAGTMVQVQHLGLVSHPQMESLSYMQVAREKIYQALLKKKDNQK